jgi:hypothetical protein
LNRSSFDAAGLIKPVPSRHGWHVNGSPTRSIASTPERRLALQSVGPVPMDQRKGNREGRDIDHRNGPGGA